MSVLCLEFKENHLISALAAPPYSWLDILSDKFKISIFQRGNQITLEGTKKSCQHAANCLQELYQNALEGQIPQADEIEIMLGRMQAGISVHENEIKIGTKKLQAASQSQRNYMNAIHANTVVLGAGPAGTGKTYIAVGFAVKLLLEGSIERIILSRPAVEAGERLGYLPGDMREKIDPYFQPLFDSLHDFLGRQETEKAILRGDIEIAPLAFMRGRTLKNAFILLDEAQNCTPIQMKMFLTRLGENSHMVINGDLSQIDLPKTQLSGLEDAINRLKNLDDIAICHFSIHDVIRHSLVTKILLAYENDSQD